MLILAKRNIKIYFRDRAAVLFSLLSVLITIGLYVLFLKDSISMGDMELVGQDVLTHSWVVSGMIAVATVTTTLGVLQSMVSDNTFKIKKDFASAPIKRWQVTGGYILSAYAVGVLMSIITLGLGQLYIRSAGGELLSMIKMAKVVGIILLTVFSSSAMIVFLVSFFKSESAFTTASTIIGTLIGFFVGTYIPIGELPGFAQGIIKLFPPSHAGVLIRKIMMEKPMEVTFSEAPVEVIKQFKKSMGIVLMNGEDEISIFMSIAILVLTGVVFFALGIWNMSRREK